MAFKGSNAGQGLLAQARANTRTKQLRWSMDEQREAIEYGPAPLVLSGGFGSSKTTTGCLKLLILAELFPRSRWAIFRRKHTDLMKTTFPTFLKLCPPEAYAYGGRRADNEKSLMLNNGSEFLWLHMDDPDLETVIGGLEINGFLGDQAEEIEEGIFDKMDSRTMRWDQAIVPLAILEQYRRETGTDWPWINEGGNIPLPPPFEILTCNPDVETHWIFRRFHPDSEEHDMPLGEDGDQPSYKAQGYKMIIMDSEKNIFLPKKNIEKMLQKDKSFIRKYVKGVWGMPEGQIHEVSELSKIPGTPDIIAWIKTHCHVFGRALDHGDTAPTAVGWFAADRAGNLFFYQEYYKPDALVTDHRANITALSLDFNGQRERYQYNVADPQIFIKTMQKHGGKFSISDEYMDCSGDLYTKDTALFWTPADNNEMTTRNRINELLRVDPNHIHPLSGQRGAPRIYFVTATHEWPTGCRYLIKETTDQRREKLGTLHGKPMFSEERDPKIADHGYDVVRYAVAAKPVLIKIAAPEKDPRTFAGKRRMVAEFKRRGGLRLLYKKAAREGRS